MRTSLPSVDIVALNIGETFDCNHFVVIKCHGIGSCIALFLFDTINLNSAGAHIMLPGTFDGINLSPNHYALNAIQTIVASMMTRGSELTNIRAAVIGGANIARLSGLDVGKQNSESVVIELKKLGIPITQLAIGNSMARTARFCSRSRRAQITTVDFKYENNNPDLCKKMF